MTQQQIPKGLTLGQALELMELQAQYHDAEAKRLRRAAKFLTDNGFASVRASDAPLSIDSSPLTGPQSAGNRVSGEGPGVIPPRRKRAQKTVKWP